MERTTRTNTFESTSARKDEKANEGVSINDAPADAFHYDAPAQMKAEEDSSSAEATAGRELQMKPEEGELQMKQEEDEVQLKQREPALIQHKSDRDDEKKTQLKAQFPLLASAIGPATKTKMPETVQAKMQNSFGEDFSNVNIHKDSSSATQMGAQAYAQGNDVHFAPGKYDPNTQGGQELLGHELTHVVQQRQGRVNGSQNKDGANINNAPSLENEADVMGAKAAKGQPAKVNGKGSAEI